MGDQISELEEMIAETQREIERMRSDILANSSNIGGKTRALALANTKLDEARFWLREVRS